MSLEPQPAPQEVSPLRRWCFVVGLPFLASRLLILAAGAFGRHFQIRGQPDAWLHMFSKWDGGWYVRIALDGYGGAGAQSVAFFPLYPLSIRSVASLVPGGASFEAGSLIGVVLSNLFALAALHVLDRLAVALTKDDAVARRTVLLAVAYPASMYLSFAYTESLYLLLLALTALFAVRGQWGRAGAAGFLLATTRPTGLLLGASLLWLAVQAWRSGQLKDRPWRVAVALAGPALGFAAVAWNAWRVTGAPLAVFQVQQAWGRGWSSPLQTLFNPGYPEPHVDGFNRLFIVVFVVLVALAWRYSETRWLVPYAALCMVPLLFSGTLMSSTRLLFPQLPCFLVAGMLLRRQELLAPVAGLLFGLQAMLMVGWSAGRFVS